ncbi:hypothetical protein Tco_1180485, partial [Tanacetum coccineum]
MVNGVATIKTSREALKEWGQIEETQNSWKETQWRQHMEQMSRVREQAMLQNRSIPGQRPRKEAMISEKSREEDMVREKVIIRDDHSVQLVVINGKLSIE